MGWMTWPELSTLTLDNPKIGQLKTVDELDHCDLFNNMYGCQVTVIPKIGCRVISETPAMIDAVSFSHTVHLLPKYVGASG